MTYRTSFSYIQSGFSATPQLFRIYTSIRYAHSRSTSVSVQYSLLGNLVHVHCARLYRASCSSSLLFLVCYSAPSPEHENSRPCLYLRRSIVYKSKHWTGLNGTMRSSGGAPLRYETLLCSRLPEMCLRRTAYRSSTCVVDTREIIGVLKYVWMLTIHLHGSSSSSSADY